MTIFVTKEGNYRMVVRVTDKAGSVPTGEVREPFPNGATGYHMVDAQASRQIINILMTIPSLDYCLYS
jgi:hypothetical protein